MVKSPTKAIRSFCLSCCGGSSYEVSLCPTQICPLKEWRFGKNPYLGVETEEIKNPVKVISNFCKYHCSPDEPVKECQETDCQFYPFRLGENPFRPERTPAQIEASRKAGERLRIYRKSNEKQPFSEQEGEADITAV